jgi:hypothetical protein
MVFSISSVHLCYRSPCSSATPSSNHRSSCIVLPTTRSGDADQTLFEGSLLLRSILRSSVRSSTHLRMIERPTHDSDRSHLFKDSLLEQPMKMIEHTIERPPALERTQGIYVIFLHFIIIIKCLLDLGSLYFVFYLY